MSVSCFKFSWIVGANSKAVGMSFVDHLLLTKFSTTRVKVAVNLMTLLKSGLIWARHCPSLDGDSVTSYRLSRLDDNIVRCRPIFSCTSLTQSSNTELYIFEDVTVSSMLWASPGTLLKFF